MPIYAIPPEGCADYLTAGKRYKVLSEEDGGFITDNDGDELYCRWINCAHAGDGNWTREEVAQDDTETLRDRFAMAALWVIEAPSYRPMEVAGAAYAIADAMMIARGRV